MKKLLIILPALMLLTACNPKKSSTARVTTTLTNSAGVTGGNLGGFNITNQCPQGMNGIGSIFDGGGQASLSLSGTFQDRVKALLSATVAANEIGMISGAPNDQTGVRFQGAIKLDANGNVVASQSAMQIKIYDSYVQSSQLDPNGVKYEPISIDFKTGQSQISGQFNLQTGDGYITFKDAYGELRFEGRLDAQNFQGLVKFQNTQNVNGGSALGGVLGQFMVARCGIIQ